MSEVTDEKLDKTSLDQTPSHHHDSDVESVPAVEAKVEAPGASASEFPDGGWEAWLVVVGGFCTIFASFGWINCIGIFQDYYSENQLKAYSSSEIAWIPSTESCMMFLWGPVAGKLTDDLGPRIPILIGSVLHILGLMMMSISKEYYQFFLSQSICSAIGCSFLFYPVLTACASWFLRHRALAFGIMVAGSSIGGIILPIMVNQLVGRLGFGWTIRVIAFFLLGMLVIGNLTIKSRLPPLKRKFSFRDFFGAYTEPPFLFFALGSVFVYLGGFLPFNFIILQAKSHGMSTELAGYLIPIVNASSTFGRIIPAHFGDLYGCFNVMIVLTTLAGTLNLALWLPSTGNAAIIVYAVFYGFASGCFFSILPAMVAQISDVRQLGVRTGSMYVPSAIAVLVGSPIAGAISNSQNGGFSGLIIFSGVTILVGVAFVVMSRFTQVGMKVLVKC